MCEKLTVFFYTHFQKRRSNRIEKPKTLDQLRAEKERAEAQLAQEQHKPERLENRKKYLEKAEQQRYCHCGFFEYRFTILPVLLTIPVFLLLGWLIPCIMYHHAAKCSIVEQLRDAQ